MNHSLLNQGAFPVRKKEILSVKLKKCVKPKDKVTMYILEDMAL